MPLLVLRPMLLLLIFDALLEAAAEFLSLVLAIVLAPVLARRPGPGSEERRLEDFKRCSSEPVPAVLRDDTDESSPVAEPGRLMVPPRRTAFTSVLGAGMVASAVSTSGISGAAACCCSCSSSVHVASFGPIAAAVLEDSKRPCRFE